MSTDVAATTAVPASDRVRRLGAAGLIAAFVSAGSAIAWDWAWRQAFDTADEARSFAAVAMLLAGAVAVGNALERRHRELWRRRWALLTFAVGFAIVFWGQTVGYLVSVTGTGPFPATVEDVPLLVGGPLLAVACVGVSWPPGMTSRDVLGVTKDSILALSCLLIVWLLVLIPLRQESAGEQDSLFQGLDLWVQLLGLMAVVVMAATSRRSGSLPIRQLMLVQGMFLVYLTSDLVGDLLPSADRFSAITWSIVGYVAAVALFRAFAVRPALETEPGTGWYREVWAYAVPYVPVPVAGVTAVWYRLTQGPLPLGTLLLVITVLLVGSIVLLADRALQARDRRREAGRTVAVSIRDGVRTGWFESLVGASQDMVTVVDRDARIVYQTPSVTDLLGYESSDLIGRPFADLIPDRHRDEFPQLLLRSAHDSSDRGPHDLALVDHLGRLHDTEMIVTPLRTEGSDGFVLTIRDVTDRRRLRAELVDSELRDPLTRLPNREAFLAGLRRELQTAVPGTLAVALFDLDNFRAFNDSRGHEDGDQVLRAVAEVLARMPASVSAVARTGADEFGMVVVADPVEPVLGQVDRELRGALDGVLMTDGRIESVPLDLGYTVLGSRDTSSSDLMEQADLAIAAARADHATSLVRYEASMRSALIQRLRAEADLREALATDRLVVYYQPAVSLADGSIISVEALARLTNPDGSLVPPDDFIPLAEELGLIKEIGRRVLRTALADLRTMDEALDRPIAVAVNVSADQLDGTLPEVITDALRATGADPADLVIELTESVLAGSAPSVRDELDRVRALGCQLALDDFGTGYSSMTYLAELPVDQLKIDRSFVGTMGSSRRALVLVRTLLQLTQSLGLTAVAEGVETLEQADLLRGMDCARAQGYLFARPLPLHDLLLAIQITGGVLPLESTSG